MGGGEGGAKLGKVLSVYKVQNFTLQSLNVAVRCQEYNFGEVKLLDLCVTVPCGPMPLCGQCKHFMGRATSNSDGIFRFFSGRGCDYIKWNHPTQVLVPSSWSVHSGADAQSTLLPSRHLHVHRPLNPVKFYCAEKSDF